MKILWLVGNISHCSFIPCGSPSLHLDHYIHRSVHQQGLETFSGQIWLPWSPGSVVAVLTGPEGQDLRWYACSAQDVCVSLNRNLRIGITIHLLHSSWSINRPKILCHRELAFYSCDYLTVKFYRFKSCRTNIASDSSCCSINRLLNSFLFSLLTDCYELTR